MAADHPRLDKTKKYPVQRQAQFGSSCDGLTSEQRKIVTEHISQANSVTSLVSALSTALPGGFSTTNKNAELFVPRCTLRRWFEAGQIPSLQQQDEWHGEYDEWHGEYDNVFTVAINKPGQASFSCRRNQQDLRPMVAQQLLDILSCLRPPTSNTA